MKSKIPANIDELCIDMLEAYALLRDDPKRHNQVGEMANMAGKVIAAKKLELEYAHLRGEQPTIPFLHYNKPADLAPREIAPKALKTLPASAQS